jgi:hypothetical protein
MSTLNVKPSDKLVKGYYAALCQYSQLRLNHEGTVRSAFQAVLAFPHSRQAARERLTFSYTMLQWF